MGQDEVKPPSQGYRNLGSEASARDAQVPAVNSNDDKAAKDIDAAQRSEYQRVNAQRDRELAKHSDRR